MKSRTMICVAAITLAVTGMSVQLTAQEEKAKHHHCQVHETHAFGGPNSSFLLPSPEAKVLSNSGAGGRSRHFHLRCPASTAVSLWG
jgi:hypothetical protein